MQAQRPAILVERLNGDIRSITGQISDSESRAAPPGKGIKNLEALSGGEQALYGVTM